VAFDSSATNLAAGSSATNLSAGSLATNLSAGSLATNLANGSSATDFAPTWEETGIGFFVRDREMRTTERVRDDACSMHGFSPHARATSADDGSVAFVGYASDFFTDVAESSIDILVRDGSSSLLERVSVDVDGIESDANSSCPSISADARCVAFQSSASRLVHGDTNGFLDVFVRERCDWSPAVSRDRGVAAARSCPCSNRLDSPDPSRKR
jgi:hypothetical protein